MATFKASDVVIIALSIFAFLYDRIPSALLHIVSPDLLDTADITADNTTTNPYFLIPSVQVNLSTAEKMGILNGIMNAPVLTLGFLCGWLISTIDTRITLSGAFFAKSFASFLMAITRNYYILLLAAFIQGTGMFTASVSVYALIASTFKSDVIRGRLNALGSALILASYSLGSLMGGVVYSNYGQMMTFIILGSIEATLAVCFLFSLCLTRSEQEEETPLTEKDERKTQENVGYLSILKTCKIAILFLQTFLVYCCTGIVTAMSSYWLQEEKLLSMTETGLIFTIATVVNGLLLILITIFVTTNFRRKLTIFSLLSVQAAAIALYPEAYHVVLASICQNFVELGKSAIRSLLPTILVFLVDKHKIGSYGRVLTMMTIVKTSAGLLASFVSGFIYEFMGWRLLCYAVAMVSVLSSGLSFYYLNGEEIKLKRLDEEGEQEQKASGTE